MSEIENLRFSIMASRDNASMLNDPLLALTIKGEFAGKTYGTTVQLPNVYGEIPAEEFVMAVNTLQETMRQIVEELGSRKWLARRNVLGTQSLRAYAPTLTAHTAPSGVLSAESWVCADSIRRMSANEKDSYTVHKNI